MYFQKEHREPQVGFLLKYCSDCNETYLGSRTNLLRFFPFSTGCLFAIKEMGAGRGSGMP